jgi:hypothetical protein
MQRTRKDPLTRLAGANPTAVFLGTLLVALVGLFAPGVIGGGVLLLLALGMIALLVTTWPVQAPGTRVVRLVLLTLLLTVALAKLL